MERYYHGLLRYLNFKLKDSQTAADAAHDAYLRLLEHSPQLVIEYPKAYLYRTATNAAIDGYRRNVVRQSETLESVEGEEGAQLDTPHHALDRLQQAKLVDIALDELSEPCRRAFLLRKLDEFSHAEIAAEMGISKDMVEKHIVNAMKHCRIRVRELELSAPARRRYSSPVSCFALN